MALSVYSGILGKKNAAHLLRRAAMHCSRNTIDDYSNLSAAEAISRLFEATEFPSAPVDPATGLSWVDLIPADNEDDPRYQEYFKRWWLGVLHGAGLTGNNPGKMAFLTRERLVFFLHTHFTAIQEVISSSRALYFQNSLFRLFAQSEADINLSFKELAKKICLDNAMLLLLDGELNVKGRPNENFAREFLELYTIGKGLPGHTPVATDPGDYIYFTEQDVQAAARIFSGYDFDRTFQYPDPETGLPRIKPRLNNTGIATQHDNTAKHFSFRFSEAVIQPDSTLLRGSDATEESMHDEIDQLISLLFEQEETVRNICRKVYRFYVYHHIPAAVENTVIAEMATVFRKNNFELVPLIKALLASKHFYDATENSVADGNYGALIKSPLDLSMATLSFFNYELPDPYSDSARFYELTGDLLDVMQEQGMHFLNPYDVAGYEAYFQFPLFNRNWISANSLTYRYKYIADLVSGKNSIKPDILSFIKNNFDQDASDPEGLTKSILSYCFPMYEEGDEITPERVNYFVSRFLRLGTGLPQGPVVFWNFSYNNAAIYIESRDDADGMLQDLFNVIMQSPEYQLF